MFGELNVSDQIHTKINVSHNTIKMVYQQDSSDNSRKCETLGYAHKMM